MLNLLQDHIGKWEGGYSNNPADAGGETVRGITWNTFQGIAPKLGWPATRERFLGLTENDFKRVVKYFWDISKADKINPSVGAFITQLRWGGQSRVKSFVDQVFASHGITDRVPASTFLSDSNIKYLNKLNPVKVFNQLHQLRVAQHTQRAQTVPGQAQFLQGWLRRAADFNATFNPEKKSPCEPLK